MNEAHPRSGVAAPPQGGRARTENNPCGLFSACEGQPACKPAGANSGPAEPDPRWLRDQEPMGAAGVAGLGTLRQLAWVVSDIERAMAHWSAVLGVGPWFYKPAVGVTQFRYRGEDSALPDLSIAFANSGELQLELIQQRNDAPSMYRDFLVRNGEGMQHIAFWTDAYDQATQDLLTAGYTEGHAGRVGDRGRFAYFEHADIPGSVVEVSEQSGGKAEFFRQIREAAQGWDGRDPVRVVGKVG